MTFILSLFNRGVCLPSNKENELNLKNPKIKQQKIKFESEQKKKIFSRKNGRKNNHDLYRSLDYIPRLLKILINFFQVVKWEKYSSSVCVEGGGVETQMLRWRVVRRYGANFKDLEVNRIFLQFVKV